jgi:hypothetical protein
VYIARLGIADLEMLVAAMMVRAVPQLAMKCKDIIHQAVLEFLHVSLFPFAAHEFLPRLEQVLDGDDILVAMTESDTGQLNVIPPQRILPVIEHAVTVYKYWYECRDHLPMKSRYVLADKIDAHCIAILELLFIASYQNKDEKLPTIRIALRKSDILKFLLRIIWEIRALDSKRYAVLSEKIDELGRMIGGWKKGIESKTPASEGRGRKS